MTDMTSKETINLIADENAASAAIPDSVTITKPEAVHFRIADFSYMETPAITAEKLEEHLLEGTDPKLEVQFGKGNGAWKRIKVSLPWLTKATSGSLAPHLRMSAEGDDLARGERGSIHYFAFLQKLNGKGEPQPLLASDDESKLTVVMTTAVPRYSVPHNEVGNDKHADGVRRLITEVNTRTGVAIPKSLPLANSRDKVRGPAEVSKVIKALSAAKEIKVGQRFAGLTVEVIERASPTATTVTVKFAEQGAVTRRSA